MLVNGRHLTYCSNIHPGESWSETLSTLRGAALDVKRKVQKDAPFALGLRLSNGAAEELLHTSDALDALHAELVASGMYVFTLNGFPYGAFHGTRVKEQVYRPDWRDPRRLAYTARLVEILRVLLPPGGQGSISTVPVGFRPDFQHPGERARAVEQLVACAALLFRVHEEHGVDIALAIEPEPACWLETTAEAIGFFENELWSRAARGAFVQRTGVSEAQAECALRRHLGLCLDTCHAAVEFEDAHDTVRSIASAGVRLAKVQATTGLHVATLDAESIAALRPFADPVYLHQVVGRSYDASGDARLRRFVDLDEALAAHAREPLEGESFRVHFHVPVFEQALAPFQNTQPFLREALAAIVKRDLCRQFEVETYTWSVLPERYRTLALADMIAGELSFVAQVLAQGGAAA
jgi:sugar phosphate isomerase/epimerase